MFLLLKLQHQTETQKSNDFKFEKIIAGFLNTTSFIGQSNSILCWEA